VCAHSETYEYKSARTAWTLGNTGRDAGDARARDAV